MIGSPADDTDKSVRLKELRAQLQVLEKGAAGARTPLAFGLPALDRHLGGGLPRGCLHEVAGAVDDGAALGFCAALAGRLAADRPVLWCQPEFDLYAPGLAAFGLDPARLIVATARRPGERLWALEEGLRCPALAAAVIELDALDMTAGRRLQLAAEASGVTGIVLHPAGLRTAAASVAVTRWTVISAGHGVHRSNFRRQATEDRGQKASRPDSLPVQAELGMPAGTFCLPSSDFCPLPAGHGVHCSIFRGQKTEGSRQRVSRPAGHGVHPSESDLAGLGRETGTFCLPSSGFCPLPLWQVELRRCRGGRPGRWLIEWTEGGWRDATGDVALAAALRDRPDPQAARA